MGKMEKEMGTQVAAAKKAELSNDDLDFMAQHAGTGTNFDTDDLVVPFLRLAQKMSPELSKNDAKYIKGLDYGDMFNNLTHEVFPAEDGGVNVIVCGTRKKAFEFTPQEAGGGWVGELALGDNRLQKIRREGSKEFFQDTGNECVIAEEFICLLLDESGGWDPIIVDMKGTQRQVAKRWRTMIKMQKFDHPKHGMVSAPIFACIWNLTSVDVVNKANQTYANYKVDRVGFHPVDLRPAILSLVKSCEAGEIKTKSEGEGSDNEPIQDNEVPF